MSTGSISGIDRLPGMGRGAVVRSARWVVLMASFATLTACSSSGSVQTAPASQSSAKATTAPSAPARAHGPLTFRPVLSDGTDQQPIPSPSSDSETRAEAALASLDCTHPDQAPPVADTEYLAACSLDGKTKYLLGPSAVSGAHVQTAKHVSAIGGWAVEVTLDSVGAKQFGDLTSSLAGTGRELAIAVGATVESAPTVQTPITDGRVRIDGKFDQNEAAQLAAVIAAG